MKLNQLFIIIFILLISVFPRLWQLPTHPPLIVDEPANLRDIDKLLINKGFHPIDFEWGYGQATLVHYPTVILIKLGLEEFFALRLTSVILSLLSLIPFYFIVKRHTNSIVAFSSTLLFSFSYYFLQFSRVGWTNIHPIFLGLYLLWVIDLALEKKSMLLIALSGIIAGLIMYMYRSGEIFIFAAIILLIINLLKNKNFKYAVTSFAIFTISFFAISLPWINKILSNWELYNLRARVVSIFNAEVPYHGLYEQTEIMLYQILTSIKAWIFMLPVNGGGIENPRYLPLNHSVVSPIIAILFFLGFAITFHKWKEYYLFLLIFFVGLVFGQILTIDPPNGSKGLILLPMIYLFSSFGLFFIYERFKKNKLTAPIIVLTSFIIAVSDFYIYTNWMDWIKV